MSAQKIHITNITLLLFFKKRQPLFLRGGGPHHLWNPPGSYNYFRDPVLAAIGGSNLTNIVVGVALKKEKKKKKKKNHLIIVSNEKFYLLIRCRCISTSNLFVTLFFMARI
jgi:hypothetical protein